MKYLKKQERKRSCFSIENGEASGARTQDLLLKRELLYQLS